METYQDMETCNMETYKEYIVWYETRSKKHTREIKLSSYEKAFALFNVLEREFKYLIGVDENGIHHTLQKT